MPELDMKKRTINFSEAIREGLDQAMEKDARVILIGEGVPDPKAIFNTTAGLLDKYGKRRVFDMPLAENGMTGICIGAALGGMRPVMVHQRIDFAILAMDQLINNAAKWHYMFDGKATVPLVVRMIVGRGWGQGPQHSQSLQAMFAQIPGLKVIMPTTPRDAKGMLISAIEDENPVLFIEHRWLHPIKGTVPEDYYQIPLDQAEILHTGTDITIAAFSYMAYEALSAAKALASMGISVEVLNMRSVRPLDIDSVLDSVRKTGRLIVADTASRAGSIAGELISQVVENAFDALKACPVRIASPDHPAPTSQYMTEKYYPGPNTVADAVVKLIGADINPIDYANLLATLRSDRPHDVPNNKYSGPF
ncbi:acetoin dehydrogenase [Sulfurimicrobium lacus]|uniref:Acetoin dehydrogenase n=1 Tax=Sulfurimicrobium lacus TaxID=2715678 RepID=A0A6F8VB49_9PROT|nr:transketolase C-terminal domain-containing protein [Sulfurimicrobium lacus]BCB26938.1 acetoin dehydrogenase [Sulfurimicrobium lacus]